MGCVFQGGQEDAVCKTKMENAREDGQEDCIYPSDTSSDPTLGPSFSEAPETRERTA